MKAAARPTPATRLKRLDGRLAGQNAGRQDSVSNRGQGMKFCSQCGNAVTLMIPAGDNRMRHVCGHCATVHYENPRIVAGCLPVWRDQVLLCRRGIEPRRGYWTLPAGFMENGETTEQAAARETLEEACARVRDLSLYTFFDLPHISQVYMMFRAELVDLDFGVGEESLEVRLFEESQIPWSELAFPTIGRTLECFFADRRQNAFPVRNEPLEALGTHYTPR
jgi:ADP-ribose pyrophosphatase YjhB (NUDIX family)